MVRKSKEEYDRWGGEWSKKKLDSVEKYLKAYLEAMKRSALDYGWELVYIDAFAGRGSQHTKGMPEGQIDIYGKEASDFIEGSSLRALSITQESINRGEVGFHKFYFFEIDKNAIEELKGKITTEYPQLISKCTFIHGDTNDELPRVLKKINWRHSRGVIFIDPYAVSFNKQLLQEVAHTYALDVWILFPLSAVIRMMSVKNSKQGSTLHKRLDDFFGSHEWFDRLYAPVRQASLFESAEDIYEREKGYRDLLAYVEGWLKEIFGSDSVLPPLVLKTSNATPLFALFSAISSNSNSAIRVWKPIAKHILENT